MLQVIEFLERMGEDATLFECSREELAQRLATAGFDTPIATALLTGDHRHLEQLLGATMHRCCLIRTPTDEHEHEAVRLRHLLTPA